MSVDSWSIRRLIRSVPETSPVSLSVACLVLFVTTLTSKGCPRRMSGGKMTRSTITSPWR